MRTRLCASAILILPLQHLCTTDTIHRSGIHPTEVFKKAIPLTALLRPSQVKSQSEAGGVGTLKVVETGTGFDAILEAVDKDAEDVVIVIRGVA